MTCGMDIAHEKQREADLRAQNAALLAALKEVGWLPYALTYDAILNALRHTQEKVRAAIAAAEGETE